MRLRVLTILLLIAIPLAGLAAGAMLLAPDEEQPQRVAAVKKDEPRTMPSYLAVSPELVAELNASLAPARAELAVRERESLLPDPSATSTTVAPPVEEEVDPAKALRVGDTAVNMRSRPSTSSPVIRALKPGEPLVYGAAERGWVSVTTSEGESGWVYGTYLTGDLR